MKRQDLTSQTYGRLTPLTYLGGRQWECKCSCGTVVPVFTNNLTRGFTQSCGCLSLETHTTHGMSTSPEYKVWAAMIQRCTNTKDKYYFNYGGRGIQVCEKWMNFENFLKDMGLRPDPSLTLERKDNDGDYKPSNCKWATRVEQMANTRKTKNKGGVL